MRALVLPPGNFKNGKLDAMALGSSVTAMVRCRSRASINDSGEDMWMVLWQVSAVIRKTVKAGEISGKGKVQSGNRLRGSFHFTL